MKTDETKRTTRWLAGITCSLLAVGCGGGGGGSGGDDVGIDAANTCMNMGSATYAGTEDVATTSGTCPSYHALSVTFHIAQAAGSCAFELTNSRVAGVTFPGTVAANAVTWTHAPYPYGGGTLTLDSAGGTLSPDMTTLTGAFTWTLAFTASSCTGTTTYNLVRQ